MIHHVEKPNSRFRDHLDPKVADWITPYEPEKAFDVALLGVPLSKTSISHSAAFRLPDAIRASFQSYSPYNMNHQLDLSEQLHVVDTGNVQMHLTDLAQCHQHIEEAVGSYWQAHTAPLVLLGGDHSVTGAAMLGLTQSTKRTYGVIHFDAHHDVRNLEDGGRTNGTPFRTLLSSGAIRGEHVVQVGLRDYVNARAYYEYVINAGVTVVTARQVFHKGLKTVLDEAYKIASDGTDGVYISFDMDVLDQCYVPGVPAPGPGGLSVLDAFEALEWLGAKDNVHMMDIVCADPAQDFRDLTTRVAANIVLSFLTGVALRHIG
ncbi:formimidoylglutamase [Alicyclobacillus curvatus]|jgi:formiminoglutamase|nr:formimidoylglutamase [Alicyclobacillus curvatus]